MIQSSDAEGINYAVQFFSDSIQNLDHFLQSYATEVTQELQNKFRNRHVAFMTVLQDTGL
jgi:hypothetical protein